MFSLTPRRRAAPDPFLHHTEGEVSRASKEGRQTSRLWDGELPPRKLLRALRHLFGIHPICYNNNEIIALALTYLRAVDLHRPPFEV